MNKADNRFFREAQTEQECPGASACCNPSWCKTASKCLHQQPGQQARAAAPLTPRELELLQGLIERELRHAKTCDAILARPDGNHRMASAQKGWDLERVALLRKLGGLGA